MAGSIGREVIVAVLGAAAVGAGALAWNWATQGGAIRALGGMTQKDFEQRLTSLGTKDSQISYGPQKELGDGKLQAGAVVAFDLKDGCPAGWSPYDKGAGRFIVGAAGTSEIDKLPPSFREDDAGKIISERQFGSKGGEQKHKLTIGEMPRHQHKQDGFSGANPNPYGVYSSNGTPLLAAADRKKSPDNGTMVAAEGEDQFHNVMPPYVALWLCKKGSS